MRTSAAEKTSPIRLIRVHPARNARRPEVALDPHGDQHDRDADQHAWIRTRDCKSQDERRSEGGPVGIPVNRPRKQDEHDAGANHNKKSTSAWLRPDGTRGRKSETNAAARRTG